MNSTTRDKNLPPAIRELIKLIARRAVEEYQEKRDPPLREKVPMSKEGRK